LIGLILGLIWVDLDLPQSHRGYRGAKTQGPSGAASSKKAEYAAPLGLAILLGAGTTDMSLLWSFPTTPDVKEREYYQNTQRGFYQKTGGS
jgi:hypothetical protein